ncbi:flagellar hook-length control protein FliK [Methylobacterium sp. C25]|uniref:flagellar hook-length control protein FliK n=1 Tax=Methylobacterium sp. C25 TaxID=2721622 RepID=UPI001F1F79C6|nr:flagellar hook-length control protein FliK [Methylobacterium sp. C25]MCE4223608.1 flagellar hook-length control protein FliK [Methylobacterium sp. C25]
MSLTLKDVVENQMRLRASGVRRDADDTRARPQGARESFSVDTSERPAAPDAAKARSSQTDVTKRQDEQVRPERNTDVKSAAPRPDRPDTAKKPAASGRAGKSQDSKAAQKGAAEASGAEAVKGDTRTIDPASGEAAPVETTDAGSQADASSIVALFVAPPAVAPPPIATSPASDGGALSDDASEIEITEGATKGAAPSDPKSGAASATAAGAKAEFQAMLGEPAASLQSGDAGQTAASPSAEAAGTAVASPASPASTDAKATTATHPQSPTTAPVPLGAVPMTIGLRALGDSNRFEIRLDPKELGRIDVSIDIDKGSGTVGARLVVDRPETLALLQRDASSLQQALSQTGLDASAGISLSLRGDGTGQGNGNAFGTHGQQQGGDQTDRPGRQAGNDQPSIDLIPLRSLTGLGRVDIRI